ncbi:MAG: hypothetical protein IAI49_11505 [Candidatus Eremiobacteraeota bacterium]|nr:hypothetical protein [Candidatus Eremiobacteraeota bacterium]
MLRRERSALATTVALCALVGASDFGLVATRRGRAAPLSLAIHASGTVGLLGIAALVRAGR